MSEALYMSARRMPIIWLIQDNEWDISAHASEIRFGDAQTMAAGFPPIEVKHIDGTDLVACMELMEDVFCKVRKERRPFLVHATVPLLGHHTSGVRREFYRDDLDEARQRDPLPKIEKLLVESGIISQSDLDALSADLRKEVEADFVRARDAEEPVFEDLLAHKYAPTNVIEEKGERHPEGGEVTLMVDCALQAMQDLMEEHPESLLYGQDVGRVGRSI